MIASRYVSPAVRERRRIAAPLALAAGLAWGVLALGDTDSAALPICSAALLWSVPSPDAFAFFFSFVSPWSLAVGWAVMIVAMMLPTTCDQLVHVRQSTLRCLRPYCLALFLGGYIGAWILAGAVLLAAAVTVRIGSPKTVGPLAAALIVALAWQASPWKQSALNRSRRHPSLAAFAPAAYWSTLAFGVRHGLWCVASCWALMAAALLVPDSQVAVMALIAAYIWAERSEPVRPPQWRMRLPTRTFRSMAWVASRRTTWAGSRGKRSSCE